MSKQTIGRWVLGLGSVFGLSKELITDPSEQEVPHISSTENPTQETVSQSNPSSDDLPRNEPKPDQTQNPVTAIDLAKKTLDDLPTNLPTLKQPTENTPVKHIEFNLNPFLNLDHAKGFVMRIIDNVTKPCVDKITHLLPDLLPQGTIGMTVTDVSTPNEQIFRIRLDQVVTTDEQEKSWEQFYELIFHPESETTELLVEPALKDLIPAITITGHSSDLEASIQHFQEMITLARLYLQAGMEREAIAKLIAEKMKKEDKKEPTKKKALSH